MDLVNAGFGAGYILVLPYWINIIIFVTVIWNLDILPRRLNVILRYCHSLSFNDLCLFVFLCECCNWQVLLKVVSAVATAGLVVWWRERIREADRESGWWLLELHEVVLDVVDIQGLSLESSISNDGRELLQISLGIRHYLKEAERESFSL